MKGDGFEPRDEAGRPTSRIRRIAARPNRPLSDPFLRRSEKPMTNSPVIQRLLAIVITVSLLLGCEVAASAKPHDMAQEAELASCIRKAAKGRAWLERTLWGLRDQEGGWIGAAVANTNGSHDLGPLQVNSWWVPKIAKLVGRPDLHVRSWLQNDACFNAEAARWIFLSGLAVTGDYWKAIGVYHSPTGWRQARYAESVAAHLRRRFGQSIW